MNAEVESRLESIGFEIVPVIINQIGESVCERKRLNLKKNFPPSSSLRRESQTHLAFSSVVTALSFFPSAHWRIPSS